MAVNSYKEDENLNEMGKLKTLGRLFSYLALTQNLHLCSVANYGILCVREPNKPTHYRIRN